MNQSFLVLHLGLEPKLESLVIHSVYRKLYQFSSRTCMVFFWSLLLDSWSIWTLSLCVLRLELILSFFFLCGYPVVPIPFIKNFIFSPVIWNSIFIIYQTSVLPEGFNDQKAILLSHSKLSLYIYMKYLIYKK